MPGRVFSLLVVFCLNSHNVNGRLTEFMTERLPVLAHNLHEANIDLKAITKRAVLGPHSALVFKNGDLHQTAKGSQRIRLIQKYGGYEVIGPTVVAELTMEGHFTGHLYGRAAKDLHKDIPNPEACVRDVKTLLNIAVRLERLNPGYVKPDKSGGKRVIYADPDKRKARIVYVVEFFYNGDDFVSLPVYFFDACSNRVIFSYNDITNFTISKQTIIGNKNTYQFYQQKNHSGPLRLNPRLFPRHSKVGVGCDPSANGEGGNKKMGKIDYGSPPFCLPVRKSSGRCRMDGVYFKVVDNEESRTTDNSDTVDFRCSRGYRDSVNGAYGVANDALYFGELTGRFFHAFLGQKAVPFKSRIVVHFGKEYENAFWTGRDMFFGDGKDNFYPLVSVEIIAHELAHGITRRHSNLLYRGQSGGINEAFSDIAGVVAASYIFGRTNWAIGGDVMKSRGALRYLNNPPKDGRSIKFSWSYRPGMDVHLSSGVFNYAFYKMVDGWRGSMKDAFANFYIANKLLWGRLTTFREGACNVMQASYDAGTNYRMVRRAFLSTGIPLVFCRKRGIWTTLFAGETRQNILVSRNRSPILEINTSHGAGYGLQASISDPGTNLKDTIRIVVATDDDADNVIVEGNNFVKLPVNYTSVHVKLTSGHRYDVKVTLKVLI